MQDHFLQSSLKIFKYYKYLGEQVFAQLEDEQLFWHPNEESNSIATIVKHLWGNMMSRWTDFLTTDGEKDWRKRDAEFLNDINSREEMIEKWEAGWNCVFEAFNKHKIELDHIVYIRNEGHTVLEVIHRQIAHYAYHIGQIVQTGKTLKSDDWKSLTIPRGQSRQFNSKKFEQEKHRAHFTDKIQDIGSE